MTSHILHPDVMTHGLADGCPRCEEHARFPARSLDLDNMKRLLRGEIHTELDEVAARTLKAFADIGNVELAEDGRLVVVDE